MILLLSDREKHLLELRAEQLDTTDVEIQLNHATDEIGSDLIRSIEIKLEVIRELGFFDGRDIAQGLKPLGFVGIEARELDGEDVLT